MAAQISPEKAAARATDVLVNDGTLEELRRKTEALYRRWMGVLEEDRSGPRPKTT